ncbi:hypothetical protein [Brevundimonas poindexterae]|uniref:hypothetical protein n=1 Tax=Brevundimonas poindexterae TaxID=74325 RepID=UPI001CFF532F|nr:hypothetical protein [Brevundimonas poindexterae]
MSRILAGVAGLCLLAALGGCTAVGEPALDAQGCRPATTIYQPGVGPGGGGQVIHIPRSCPRAALVTPEEAVAAAVIAGAEDALRDRSQDARPPVERPDPPPPVSVEAAIRNGIEDFCGWFFSDAPYSMDGLRQAAFDAGYAPGSPAQFFPLPEMLRAPSFSSLGFTAIIADRLSDRHGVVAFVSFHHPTCQIQLYGHGPEGDAVIAQLEAEGWHKAGAPVEGGGLSAQRYYGGDPDQRLTMVVSRVIGEDPDRDGAWLDMIINVVPGEDPQRGLMVDPDT